MRAIMIICVAAGLLLILSAGAFPLPPLGTGAGGEAAVQEAPGAAAEGGEVHPPALPARQRVGVAVFLAWMWVLVGVLLYFLRLKVREADRVFRAGFYEARESGGEEPRSS